MMGALHKSGKRPKKKNFEQLQLVKPCTFTGVNE
jgi:hypothetical protein